MQRIECQTNESIFFSGSLARDHVDQLYKSRKNHFNHFFEHLGDINRDPILFEIE